MATEKAGRGKLTERQERFLAAFLSRGTRHMLCATRAAAVAGYRWPGKQGPRLLSMPHIRAAIDAGLTVFRAEQEAIARARAARPQRRKVHVGKS